MTLSKLLKIPLKFLESILVLGYILFEEIIWNTFAKPTIEYLKHLSILNALKSTFLGMNRYLLVFIFVLILVIAEGMGILSLMTIAQNQIVLGVFIYALKIPIATFTFWLFDLTKPQLMTFSWLKTCYDLLMRLIDLILKSTIYQSIKSSVQALKQKIRDFSNQYIRNNWLFKQLKAQFIQLKALLIKPRTP